MPDTFSVTSSQSWGGRLMESIKSVLVGFVFFIASFPLLFWNEGRAVQTAKSLKEGLGAVVSVASDAVQSGNEGKLVHVSGAVDTGAPLEDPEWHVQAEGIKLIRKVQMYQWKEEEKSETQKKLGGGSETKTTYTYSRDWSEELIDSSSFHETEGHENPGEFYYAGQTFVADAVHVGAFQLSTEQIDQLTNTTKVPITEAAAELPEHGLPPLAVADGEYYRGENPSSPQVGDTRISFEVVNPSAVSLVGVQTAETFAAFQAAAGDSILLVEEGTHTAAEMFKTAQDRNAVLTWILRLVGFVLSFFGTFLIFRPIAVFADVLPIFGTILGAGIGLFSFLVSAALSSLTIAVAWLFVRPLLAVVLLALAGGAIFWLVKKGRAKKAQRLATA